MSLYSDIMDKEKQRVQNLSSGQASEQPSGSLYQQVMDREQQRQQQQKDALGGGINAPTAQPTASEQPSPNLLDVLGKQNSDTVMDAFMGNQDALNALPQQAPQDTLSQGSSRSNWQTLGGNLFSGAVGVAKGLGADAVSRVAGGVLNLPKEPGYENETPAQQNDRLTQEYLTGKLGHTPTQENMTAMDIGKTAGGMAAMMAAPEALGGGVLAGIAGGALAGGMQSYGGGQDFGTGAAQGALFAGAGTVLSKTLGAGLSWFAPNTPGIIKSAIQNAGFGAGGEIATSATTPAGQQQTPGQMATGIVVPMVIGMFAHMGTGKMEPNVDAFKSAGMDDWESLAATTLGKKIQPDIAANKGYTQGDLEKMTPEQLTEVSRTTPSTFVKSMAENMLRGNGASADAVPETSPFVKYLEKNPTEQAEPQVPTSSLTQVESSIGAPKGYTMGDLEKMTPEQLTEVKNTTTSTFVKSMADNVLASRSEQAPTKEPNAFEKQQLDSAQKALDIQELTAQKVIKETSKRMQAFAKEQGLTMEQVKTRLEATGSDKIPEGLIPKDEEITKMAVEAKKEYAINLQQFAAKGPEEFTTNRDIKFKAGDTNKNIGQSIRDNWIEIVNSQKLKGFHGIARMEQGLSNEDNIALSFYHSAGGDLQTMRGWLKDADPKLAPYKPAIQKAIGIMQDPAMMKKAATMQRFYNEVGTQLKDSDVIGNLRDNFENRNLMFKPRETAKGGLSMKKAFSTVTPHSKQRIYPDIVQRIKAGHEVKDLSATHAMSIHAEEAARLNANAKLSSALVTQEMGEFMDEPTARAALQQEHGSITALPGISKAGQKFYVRTEMANQLKSITEAVTKATKAGEIYDKTSGIMKTVSLSMSGFHDKAMVMTAIAQGNTEGILKALNIKNLDSYVMSKAFQADEVAMVSDGGTTDQLKANQDIMKEFYHPTSAAGKAVAETPGIKQFLNLNEKHNEFLFGKLQRVLKVTDYKNQVSKYLEKNPNASGDEMNTARRQIARQVNAAYGGLNWESLGITPNTLKLARRTLLAPDWTGSNIEMIKQAFGKGPGAAKARAHIVSGIVSSTIITQAANYLLTGHFTDKNESGHEMDVELRPGVYVPLFVGLTGDLMKTGLNVMNYGPIEGLRREITGKANPLGRDLAAMTQTGFGNFSPDKSWGENLKATGKAIAGAIPYPIGVKSAMDYTGASKAMGLSSTEGVSDLKTPGGLAGGAVILSGIGSYGAIKDGTNWLDYMFSPGVRAEADTEKSAKAFAKANTTQTTAMRDALAKAIQNGGSTSKVFSQYDIPAAKQKTEYDKAVKKQQTADTQSSSFKAYLSISKDKREAFLKTLPSAERNRLLAEASKAKK